MAGSEKAMAFCIVQSLATRYSPPKDIDLQAHFAL
jgi:hypothetical protein